MPRKTRKFKQWRVRQELTLRVYQMLSTFESQEEPSYGQITDEDIINVFSSIIASKTNR
jgi:hypothetical protein